MKLRSTLLTALVAAGLGLSAQAQDFPSDDLSIIVPYGPGGGFDTAVRTFAPYFQEALGGDVNVVTRNVPGAGGQRGATEVYRADPDGYTLGIYNLPGFALPAILGEELNYDLEELSWIGRIGAQDYVFLTSASSDIENLDDVQNLDEVVITSTGYGSTVLAGLQIVANVLGLEEKDPIYLSGYGGTSDALVGVVRGDGDLTMAPISTAQSYIDSGDLRPLAVTASESPYEGVPTFAEAGFEKLGLLNLERSIAGPPGIPEDRLAILREAFMEAVQNPDFQADAERAGMAVGPLSGEETANNISNSFSFYQEFSTSLENPN